MIYVLNLIYQQDALLKICSDAKLQIAKENSLFF